MTAAAQTLEARATSPGTLPPPVPDWRFRVLSWILLSTPLVLALFGLHQTLLLDEIAVPEAARRNFEGFYVHPPTYYYLLKLAIGLFGEHAPLLRGGGVLCFYLTLFVLWKIVGLSYKHDQWRVYFYCLLSFALLPLSVKSQLLVDIDNTMLTAGSFFLIWYFLSVKDWSMSRLSLLGALYGLLLWIKATTPLAFLLVFPLAQFRFRRDKGEAAALFAALLAGLLLFAVSFALYLGLRGMHFEDFLRFNYFGARLKFLADGKAAAAILAGRLYLLVFWAGFYVYFLYAAALRGLSRTSKTGLVAFLFGAVTLTVYLWLAPVAGGFPKYTSIAFVSLGLWLGLFAYESFQGKPARADGSLLGLAILSLAWFAWWGDPLHFPVVLKQAQALQGTALSSALRHGLTFIVAYAVLGAGVFFWRGRLSKLGAGFVLMLSSSLCLDIRQARADYSTLYAYGESGIEEVVDYLRRAAVAGKSVAAPKDIRYLLNYPLSRCVHEHETLGAREFQRKMTPLPDLAAFRRYALAADPESRKILGFLRSRYAMEIPIEDFVVYRGALAGKQ